MSYNWIFFDLDGTITDSGEGIFNSVKYALVKMRSDIPQYEVLKKFIGPPLEYSFKTFCHFDDIQTRKAIELYRQYYADKGIFENSLYDGVEDMLCALKQNNKKIALATSKPEKFAKRIVEHFDIEKYFDFISGAPMNESVNTTKADVIQKVIDSCGIKDKKEILMVGDRLHDIEGAKTVGVDCTGVLYGYGDRQEHEKYGADYIVETVLQLQDLILR